MFKAVPGQDRVALFQVQLHLFFQAVFLQEAVTGCGVIIILVLGRFLRFRFHQDRTLEADPVLVLDHHVQEATHVVQLLRQVGVQQGFIALAPAPKDVVLPAHLVRGVHAAFHGGGGEGEDLGVGVGRGTRHPAAVAEHVGSAPEQLDAGLRLLFRHVIGDLVQRFQVVGEIAGFRADIGIVPAVERHAQRLEHLEGDIGLDAGGLHRILRVPGAFEGLPAKRIAAFPGEAVPPGHGKAQVIFHALAKNDFVLVVMAIAVFDVGIGANVGDGGNILEEIGHVRSLMAAWAAR